MVLNSGEVKVADFGIARIDASEFTIVGDLLGTPAYMAPEQFAGAPVDKRTDLFAAGVILFEMLTGVKPFRGKSITEIILLMETRGPEDIRALNPAVPDSLKRVITKALSFDPARRYDDAAKFSKAIIEAFPVRPDETPIPEPSVLDSSVFKKEVGEGAPGGATWRSDLLRDIERDLATFIGPVAAIALKRAIRQANDIMSLYDLLARQIANPRDQAEFLARGRRRAAPDASAPSRSTPPSTSEVKGEPKPDQPTTSPGLANIAAVESNLARYIGPIAKILIKRELEKHETLDKFYHALAAHIPDERDRETFLRVQQSN
jgi:eukaryotic-like serine/threonine-protein kinase